MRASLSIDLDNKWAYLKTAENPKWLQWPSYFPCVIPRILETLADSDLSLTAFVVGRDLINPDSADLIVRLSQAGHELANHSFEHEPWLQRHPKDRLRLEIGETGRLIQELCGTRPIGFRGPGFSDSLNVHQVLDEQGYHYCASSFPSSVGPLARAYYLARTGLKVRPNEERGELFGSFRTAFARNRPYRLVDANNPLWMIPVTVQPITRLPFHFTYLFFLSERSPSLARLYFRTSLMLCKQLRVPPSLLLHPLDFLGVTDEPEMAFFPGMRLPIESKLKQLKWFLAFAKDRFDLLPMCKFLQSLVGANETLTDEMETGNSKSVMA